MSRPAPIKTISFDVEYTPQDYYEAVKIQFAPRRRSWYVLGGASLLLALIAYAISYYVIVVLYLFMAIYYLTLQYTYLRYISNRIWPGAGLGSNNHFVIDETGIENTYDKGSSKNPWSDVYNVQHNEAMLLLFIAQFRFFLIPKRAVTSDDWKELVQLKPNVQPAKQPLHVAGLIVGLVTLISIFVLLSFTEKFYAPRNTNVQASFSCENGTYFTAYFPSRNELQVLVDNKLVRTLPFVQAPIVDYDDGTYDYTFAGTQAVVTQKGKLGNTVCHELPDSNNAIFNFSNT
jgi:hypothetical protein